MKQLSLAETGFLPKTGKQTCKAVFLAEIETEVPWSRFEALIEPLYPKKGNGRPPMPLATMLRVHFLQQWLPGHQMPVWFCEGSLPWFGEKYRTGCGAVCAGESVAGSQTIVALAG